MQDSGINSTRCPKIHACTAKISGMLIQPINSRFRKDQLQQNRDQLQQRTIVGIRVLYRLYKHWARLINKYGRTISACRQSADQRRRQIRKYR